MSIKRLLASCLFFCLLLSLLTGCDLLPVVTVTSPSPTSTVTSQPTNAQAFNIWHNVANGVAVRYEYWKIQEAEDNVTITRFDLTQVHLTIGYQPSKPLLLSEWAQQEHPLAIINGGYFDKENNATGLVISNGQVYGSSYQGFGGMLSVDANRKVGLRSLRQQPYNPSNEQLQQATQSSPMLMLPGGQRTQFNANALTSRRSVVAIDKQGRLVLIVSPGNAFSLDELADLLASSDLSLDVALNLDGGASTGLYVTAGDPHVEIDSFARLPIVVMVQAN